jgi:UPF0176 protein
METETIVVSTFYKFFSFPNYQEEQAALKDFCNANELKGTILIASEGINSTISGPREGIDNLYKYLKDKIGIELDNIKESFSDYKPFLKMKVRLKKEIVKLGVGEIDVEALKGEYIEPEDWDEFISRSDVVLIDTRNKYETLLGSFEGSVHPDTENFCDFPSWFENNKQSLEGKKVAMCCTGGVRCEKSTAYLKQQGIEEVYHLNGGIINYFMKSGEKNKKWYGGLFVFDDRFVMDKQMQEVSDIKCSDCSARIDADDIKVSGMVGQKLCLKCFGYQDKDKNFLQPKVAI